MQFIRKSDGLGRIVIPMDIRRSLKIKANTSMGMSFLPSGEIILKPIPPSCRICGSEQDLHYWEEREVNLCASCCQRMETTLKGSLKPISAYETLYSEEE